MILVTGGTGLVGTHLLLRLLQEGMAITATYRTDSSLEVVKKVFSYYSKHADILFNRVIWVKAELNDLMALEKAFEKVSQVYHCAALISFDPADFQKLQKVNIEGTANIVNACLSHKIKKLCYISSIATINTSLNGSPATEEDFEPDPNNNVYALSKYAAEMEVWRGAQEGLPVVIINPGIIIGPGFWESGSGMFFRLAAGKLRYYPPGGTGFVGVSDVVSCMVLLMQSAIACERFIIIEQNIYYREILNRISAGLKQPPPKISLQSWQLGLLWRLDWVYCNLLKKRRRLTKNTVTSLKEFNRYSNHKVVHELGFEFGSLNEALMLSCEMFRNERVG